VVHEFHKGEGKALRRGKEISCEAIASGARKKKYSSMPERTQDDGVRSGEICRGFCEKILEALPDDLCIMHVSLYIDIQRPVLL
jgi:hypothetical protein